MIASMVSNHSNKKDKKKYAKKILIVLNKTFKHDESFLKLGPIKSIKELGGQTINVDWESENFHRIVKRFNLNNQKRNLESIVKNSHELFFANCIKILLHIYINKVLSFLESEYKISFIESLKYLHNGISIDNIEYLESTELITKENVDGKVIIHVNHKHSFMKDLINKNFSFFMKNKIIKSFLQESGY